MLLQIREEKKDTPHGKNTRYGIVRDSPPPWNRSHVVVFAHALGIIPTISIVAAQCPALPVHGKFARPDNEEMTKQQLFHFRALKKKNWDLTTTENLLSESTEIFVVWVSF